MTRTLPISKVREDLANLVENANKRLDEYVITVNGSPAAALIFADEYESWKETEEILADEELMKAIKQGEKDIEKGNVHDWDEVKEELKLDVQS